MPRVRVLLGDDHALILEGMRSILAPNFDIVGGEINGRNLVEAAERLRPDAVVLDVSMPILNGMEAGRQIKQSLPKTKLVYVTQMSDPAYVRAAFEIGASAYVLKQSIGTEILNALSEALEDRFYISPSLRRREALNLFDPTQNPASLFGMNLTTRQRQVLQLIAEGKSNKEIAGVMDISVKTVEFHKAGLMDQLGLRTIAELTRYAIEHGLAVNSNTAKA